MMRGLSGLDVCRKLKENPKTSKLKIIMLSAKGQLKEQEEGFKAVALSPEDTPYGSVETYEDAKKCAELFKKQRDEIDGIIVTLPNFGDERGVADTIRLAGLKVPVLVHAFPDDPNNLDAAHRRDGFCGKMSACNNLHQYGIPYSLTTLHTVAPETESFRQDFLCHIPDTR